MYLRYIFETLNVFSRKYMKYNYITCKKAYFINNNKNRSNTKIIIKWWLILWFPIQYRFIFADHFCDPKRKLKWEKIIISGTAFGKKKSDWEKKNWLSYAIMSYAMTSYAMVSYGLCIYALFIYIHELINY